MTDTTLQFDISVPQILVNDLVLSRPYQNLTLSGKVSSFGVDLSLNEPNLSKTIKARDFYLLRGKIEKTLADWESKKLRHESLKNQANKEALTAHLNESLNQKYEDLENILIKTLSVDDAVDWDEIKRNDEFSISPDSLLEDIKAPGFISFNKKGKPKEFKKTEPPKKPDERELLIQHGFMERLLFKNRVKNNINKKLNEWEAKCEEVAQENQSKLEVFAALSDIYQKLEFDFHEEKGKNNKALEQIRKKYEEKNPSGIEEYCDLVLSASEYPDFFPSEWTIEYRPEGRILLCEFMLPSPESMPTIESYRYIKTRDEISEKNITKAKQKKLFEDVIYKICIRTIHELFEADAINALDSIGFNGITTSINPATGINETKTIISILSEKTEFCSFDLSNVDPKSTFKHLKGVSAASLIDLTPIPPVIQLNKSDKRIIEGRDVANGLDSSVNLAAMHWDDFEHLIRELFEKEFMKNGGEVKVTQASSDGGVDAIAFDPDPIRGGKIVIQAKRYTNVVGVSAVRDLYGTVMNEGATKGILVTTSDYGKDSYTFAKDKPITLLNGGNLLALLAKHGHKARINVQEAKMLSK